MNLMRHRRRLSDPVVLSCTDEVRALADVWASTVAIQATDVRVVTIQREIAGWAQRANRLLVEKYRYGVASDEIRVILQSIADVVPRLPRDARPFLALTAGEASDLRHRAETALDAAVSAPVSLHPYPRTAPPAG